jgi:hypothetical protein
METRRDHATETGESSGATEYGDHQVYPRARLALSPEWRLAGDQIYAYARAYLITPPLGGLNFKVSVEVRSHAWIEL